MAYRAASISPDASTRRYRRGCTFSILAPAPAACSGGWRRSSTVRRCGCSPTPMPVCCKMPFAKRRIGPKTGPHGSSGLPARRHAPLVHTGQVCAWKRVIDFRNIPEALADTAVDAVVCSAFLDLASARWMERFCGRVEHAIPRLPDGQRSASSPHPLDRTVLRAFRRDQAATRVNASRSAARAGQGAGGALAVTSAVSTGASSPTAGAMLDDIVTEHGRVATCGLPAYRRYRRVARRPLAADRSPPACYLHRPRVFPQALPARE